MLSFFIYTHNKRKLYNMSYIFQKGLSKWQDTSGTTTLKESTIWMYPNKSKNSTNYENYIYFYAFSRYSTIELYYFDYTATNYEGDPTTHGCFYVNKTNYNKLVVGDQIYIDIPGLYQGYDIIASKFERYGCYIVTTDSTIDINDVTLLGSNYFLLIDSSRTIDKYVGKQPNNLYNGFVNKKYTVNNFKFYVNPNNDDNHNTGTVETNDQTHFQIWNKTENILGNDSDTSTFMFNQNLESKNVEKESEWLVLGDFGFSIPETAKINSIQLKVVRKNFAFNDRDFDYRWDDTVGDGVYLPYVEESFLNNYITTYTRDSVITIHDNYNDDFDEQNFENKAQIHERESVKPIKTLCDTYNSSQDFEIVSDYVSYRAPENVWSNEKETIIYGNSNGDLWNGNLTPEILNSEDFCVKIKVWQKVYRGYGYRSFYRPDVAANYTTLAAWGGSWPRMLNRERNDESLIDFYNVEESISFPLASYLISRLYTVGVKVYYDIDLLGYDLVEDERLFYNNIQVPVRTDSVYFKYQKCLDGVCYKYVDSLNDIYKNDVISGDNVNINNMYNEYNIIDKYIPNLYHVDIATNVNVDLTDDHFLIDGIELIPKQLILLYGQDSASTNDIYKVTNNFTLEKTNLLEDSDKVFRAKVYVKYGTNKGKQLFLLPKANNIFPVSGEVKEFEERHSYIIKHALNYDINNTSNDEPSKVLFTNYEVARTLNDDTKNLYKQLEINLESPSGKYTEINFKYRELDFSISSKYSDYVTTFLTGITSAHTNAINIDALGNTEIKVETDFFDKSEIGDYVEIKFYESEVEDIDNQRLLWYSQIKDKSGTDTIVVNSLSQFHIDTIMNYETGFSYYISNLNYVSGATAREYVINFLKLPLKDLVDVVEIDTDIAILFDTKSDYYKYFNYGEITITKNIYDISTSALTSTEEILFETTNQYVNYKLKPFFDNFSLIPINNVYNNDSLNNGEFTYYYTEEGNTDGFWIVIPDSNYINKLESFKPYTYVIISGDTFVTKTLVRGVNDDDLVIERPIEYSSGSFSIHNISDFEEISDLLYDVYTNYTHDYYKKQEDATRNRICAVYASIIKNNSIIRSQSTGIIYQENDLWNFDLFNIEVDENFENTFDPNLTYVPVEVLDVGVDKITKLQKPIDISNIVIPDNSIYNLLIGDSHDLNNPPYTNYSKILHSDSNYYLGVWNDGFSGSSFEYDFDTNTLTEDGAYMMLINVTSGFSENIFNRVYIHDNFYHAKIYPVKVKEIDDNIHILSYVNNGRNLSIASDSPSIGGTFDSITSTDFGTKRYLTPIHMVMDPDTNEIISTQIYSGGTTYSNIVIKDVLYDVDSKIISGWYNAYYSNSFDIDGMGPAKIDRNVAFVYNKDKYKNHFYRNVVSTTPIYAEVVYNSVYDFPTQILLNVEKYTLDKNLIMRNNGINSTLYEMNSGINYLMLFNIDDNGKNKINEYKDWGKHIIESEQDINDVKVINDNNETYVLYNLDKNATEPTKSILTKVTSNKKTSIYYGQYATIEEDWTTQLNLSLFSDGELKLYDMDYDDDYIYVVGYYSGEILFEEDIKLDTPLEEKFGIILKIDKITGGIVSAKELLSTEEIIPKTITSTSDYVDVSGYFTGTIYLNNLITTKESTEYFITRIKKDEI